jgi:hypothetical protein
MVCYVLSFCSSPGSPAKKSPTFGEAGLDTTVLRFNAVGAASFQQFFDQFTQVVTEDYSFSHHQDDQPDDTFVHGPSFSG